MFGEARELVACWLGFFFFWAYGRCVDAVYAFNLIGRAFDRSAVRVRL